MGDVRQLPGVFRADLEPETEVSAVLSGALGAGLRDVVVIGRSIAGEIEVRASQRDADQVIGLLTRGIHWLAEAEQVAGPAGE